MPQTTIPEQWRTQVCAILETEATGKLIEWTDDATKRFEASYLEAWPHEVYHAVRSYLKGPTPPAAQKRWMLQSGRRTNFSSRLKMKKLTGRFYFAPMAKGSS